ncbi:methylated-DNA--protein-cysteine methyltransferase [Varicellaria rhodocarpa]|nr:methylated-DNA--protein-cysteine methyltransferase [Varicellaria rhodocarpa]
MTTISPSDSLLSQWTTLYTQTLPSFALSARDRSAWPVHLDHCFARIIYDAVIGVDVPWANKLKSPAKLHMSEIQISKCIEMGQGIIDGRVNLKEWNQRSLDIRGKARAMGKRKRDHNFEDVVEEDPQDQDGLTVQPKKAKIQSDIRVLFPTKSPHFSTTGIHPPSTPPSPASSRPEDEISSFTIAQIIQTSDLTPFRRLTLLALVQVPRGQYTTYAAIATFLKSIPRAVGNAMRNNPFAPTVPCHRVLASNKSIGGFGGQWGMEGKFAGEKIRLLRSEGVRFLGDGKVVGTPWKGFHGVEELRRKAGL